MKYLLILLSVNILFFAVNIQNAPIALNMGCENIKLSLSVAMLGMLLSESEYLKYAKFNNVKNLVQDSKGNDENGYKAEFVRLA